MEPPGPTEDVPAEPRLGDEKEPPEGHSVGPVSLLQAGEQQRQRPSGGKKPGMSRGQRRGQRGWGAEVTDHKSRACFLVGIPICTMGPADPRSDARTQSHKAHSQPSPFSSAPPCRYCHPPLSRGDGDPSTRCVGEQPCPGALTRPTRQSAPHKPKASCRPVSNSFFFKLRCSRSSHSRLPLQRSVKMNSRQLD